MAGTNEAEVKDVEVVHVQPAGKDADDIETDDTDQDTSPENDGEADDESAKPDKLVKTKETDPEGEEGAEDGLADVEGETPKERALRVTITNLRGKLRKEQAGEILGGNAPVPAAKKDLSDQDKAVLGKYKPEEIAALKEVLPVLAKDMGYVRSDDLAGATYAEKSQEILDGFLEKHPEYLPENDKDGTLWTAFKAEYGLYKQPGDPRDFKKIFDRIHKDVFGIKPSGPLPKVNAQQEKTKVASHAGASSKGTPPASRADKPSATGLRTDMLKGFTDEEKAEMFGDE